MRGDSLVDNAAQRFVLKVSGWFVTVGFVFAAAACLVSLWLAVVPGRLPGLIVPVTLLAMLATPLVLLAAGVAWYCVGTVHLWDTLVRRHGWMLAGMLLMPGVTLVILWASVPSRIGFALSRPAFEAAADMPERSDVQPPVQIGLYEVQSVRRDGEGGVYFAVHSAGCGIGPDVTTSGFCFGPEMGTTPYGAAQYDRRWMQGRWFRFSACNDHF